MNKARLSVQAHTSSIARRRSYIVREGGASLDGKVDGGSPSRSISDRDSLLRSLRNVEKFLGRFADGVQRLAERGCGHYLVVV